MNDNCPGSWYWQDRQIMTMRARDLRKIVPELLHEIGMLRDHVELLNQVLAAKPVQSDAHRWPDRNEDWFRANRTRPMPLKLVEDHDSRPEDLTAVTDDNAIIA